MARWWHFWLIGMVLALVQAPVGLVLVLFPVLLFVLRGVSDAPTARRAGWWGWLLGFGYFSLALCWIVEPMLVDPVRTGWLAPFAVIGMGGGLALFWAGAFALGYRIGGERIRLPIIGFVWCLSEAARAFVFTGFPWADFAQATMDTPLSLVLPILGPRGAALVVLLLAVCLSLLDVWKKYAGLGAAVMLGLALQVLPGPRAVPTDAGAPMIRLVQPNAPQNQKWDPDHIPEFHRRLLAGTRAGATPDLVIWPEMALPSLLNNSDDLFGPISDAARGAPVVLGGPRAEGDAYYNSMLVLGAGARQLAVYDKRHLVPFGEYLPMASILSKLDIYGLAANGQGYETGGQQAFFSLKGIGWVRPLICYEGIFSQEVRQTQARPRLMIMITNDAWFGNWIGPKQHLIQARMRSLELGVPMARAANTGISAIIDAHGVVTAYLPMNVYGQVDEKLPSVISPTPYARFGETLFCIIAVLLCSGLFIFRLELES